MKSGTSSNPLRALRHRNYRLYFTGQSVSQIGTWMQRTAVSWLIYMMTHSAVMLGVSVFATQFPAFLFSLYAGTVSDRYNRYTIVLVTQTAAMLQALLLAAIVLRGHYHVWEILALSAVLGVTKAFDVPVRSPMIHEMIDNKDDLANAIALNSSMNNTARLAGPALSGFVLLKFGAGICFLLNGLSFIAVIIAFWRMKLPPHQPSHQPRNFTAELAEGFAYLRNTPALTKIILMVAVMSLLVMPYNTLLPVFAKVVFHGDAGTFGYINSFIGIGAMAGAWFLASRGPAVNLRKVLFINTIILGAGLILFSHIRSFPVAMVFAVCCGFGTMSQRSISNIILQTESDRKMRGRVISYFTTAVYGVAPLGSLLIGTVSKHIGATASLTVQGLLALAVVAVFSPSLTGKIKQKPAAVPAQEEHIIANP